MDILNCPYPTTIESGDGFAVFSPCKRYRYFLERRVSMFTNKVVNFIMLNPSTADAFKNDPTVARCVKFTQRWEAGILRVTNVSPFRSTDRRVMLQAGAEPDGVREANLWYISQAATDGALVVAAWGTDGKAEGRDKAVRDLLAGVSLHYLKLTKHGYPQHPLYVAGNTRLAPWR